MTNPSVHSPEGRTGPALADSAADDRRTLAEVERALANRPTFNISLRISLLMLLCFLMVTGVVLTSMVLVSRVGILQEFLDKVSTYVLEVEHARRHEKNYLLYGTGLENALTQVQAAHKQLRGSSTAVIDLVGTRAFERMENNLESYGHMLERLAALAKRQSPGASEAERAAIDEALSSIVVLLAPMVPHFCEEVWERMGGRRSIFRDAWPSYDEAAAREDTVTIAVQVNGKLRGEVEVERGADEETVLRLATAEARVGRHIEGKEIRRVVFVPGRLLNLVVR